MTRRPTISLINLNMERVDCASMGIMPTSVRTKRGKWQIYIGGSGDLWREYVLALGQRFVG